MTQSSIEHTLILLRRAADEAAAAWPDVTWQKIAGPGPDQLVQHGSGGFEGLTLEPGQDLILRARLDVPAEAGSVTLAGDKLEATAFSLYPFELKWNGQPIFEDTGVPVAAGPALFTIVPELHAGDNGEVELTVHIPDNQTTLWFNVSFMTPGLRARAELLDVAWAELSYARALALTPAEQDAVTAAAALVPTDLAQFSQATLQAMETALAPLQPKAAQHFVHVIGHSHIDMNWLWTMPDTINVVHRDFKSVVSMMEDYPELTFTHSQPATYEIIRQQAPELFERVVDLIDQGRWEPATITWVEGDTNMSSGEAMARHMLESKLFTRDHLKTASSTFLAPDTFGHAGNLPQLAVSAGAQRYYHHRCNPGQENLYPAYWWEGQDGTRLLAISTPSYNGNIRATDLVTAALRGKKFGHADSLHFHGIGDHGGGPSRHNLDALRRFQQRPLLPKAQCSTLARYTQNILDSGVALPEQHGESGRIFEGCYTTHADIKYQTRTGENLLKSADTVAALANLQEGACTQDAWRLVLFNHFHDILDGSGIHEAYEQCAVDHEAVKAAAKSVREAALKVLEAGLPAGRIAVTNPLGWEREEWVSVPFETDADTVQLVGCHGHKTIGQKTASGIGFAARVPAFGTVSYQVEALDTSCNALSVQPAFAPTDSRETNWLTDTAVEPPYYKVETPFFRVYVRRDCGILTGFFDKHAGRELVRYGMRRGSDYQDSARPDLALNVLQIEDEYPHGMSAWHQDEVHTTHSLLRGAQTRIVESGSARLVLEVTHSLRASSITQQIIFYRDLARVDFETHIDWQELGSVEAGVPDLKVAFTPSLMESEAWFETPFAAVQRPCDGQEVPALRWADVGGKSYGAALINDSKYGYDALGTRLRLTLVRSGYEPDAISDVGQHTVRFSFYPHAGDWRAAGVVHQAASFNQPLLARETPSNGTDRSAVWRPRVCGQPNVIPACLKQAADGSGMIVRLYESAGQAGTTALRGLPEGACVWETTITEDKITPLAVRNGAVELTFRPWQVRTFLIER